MELFIPTLLVLLLSALVCFFILPRLSPYILGMLAFSMLVLGIWQNYKTFPHEYGFINKVIKDYSGFVLIMLIIITTLGGIHHYHGVNTPSPLNIIPTISMPNFSGSKSIFNISGTGSPLSINSAANSVYNVLNGTATTVSNALKTPVNAINSIINRPVASTSFGTV